MSTGPSRGKVLRMPKAAPELENNSVGFRFPRPNLQRKNPLRKIVARRVRAIKWSYDAPLLIFTERLECGHTWRRVVALHSEITARRRRCAECAAREAADLARATSERA